MAPTEKKHQEAANKELVAIIEEITQEDKQVVILTHEEYADLKKMLEDRKAIGRVWGIFKTILYAIAATIIAYNTIFEHGVKGILEFFGFGGGTGK